ncbi:IS3 family transposase [Virgibacillus sp. MSJ-26]
MREVLFIYEGRPSFEQLEEAIDEYIHFYNYERFQ